MTEHVGPLVVSGDRWGLPGGKRGTLTRSVAAEAATMGAAVVLVLGGDHPLWDDDAQAQCTGGQDGREWRYRVAVPGADPVPTLVLVERDTGRRAGPWGKTKRAAAPDPAEVCAALGWLQQLLGVPWGHSTARTIEHLILSTHPVRKGGRKLDRSPAVPAVVRGCERPAHWLRPLVGWEETAPYVHTYDANAAYLGVMASLDLGFGKPEHFTTPRGCQSHMGWPGLWRVDVPANLGAGAGLLPPIASGPWVTTPTLHRLSEYSERQNLGAVIPEEGYVWPERARWLSAAAAKLRDARSAASERDALAAIAAAQTDAEASRALSGYVAAGIVREAVKELYTVLPGRLASDGEYVSAGWRRPDWAAAIIGGFRSNLHRKLERLDARPFAIGTDAVAFASDVADPVEFAGAIGLRLGEQLGQFSVQGSTMREAVAPFLARGPGGVDDVFRTAKRGTPAPPVRDASVAA